MRGLPDDPFKRLQLPVKHPLIIADSHGVYFSAVFGHLKDPWESDGTSPIQITKEGSKVGDYYVLNAKSLFFVRIVTEQGSVIDVHPQMKPMILAEINAYDHCLVSIDGNVHMANFMCKNGLPFDFMSPIALVSSMKIGKSYPLGAWRSS